MARWARGADQIKAMLDRRELQRVAGGADAATALLDSADRHVQAANRALPLDYEGAYVLAYDASRKAATALLAQQGLRPTTRGGHVAAVEAITTLNGRITANSRFDNGHWPEVTTAEMSVSTFKDGDAPDWRMR
jgi:hypothetical protein